MDETPHSAVGSALGYYYQAIYALIFLFDADENASVGIETLDDVTIINGEKKELHQLKHSIQENPKISLKSDNLWRTLRIWSEYVVSESIDEVVFTLSTVAQLEDGNPLSVLTKLGSDRSDLTMLLIEEANRVLKAREDVLIYNNNLSLGSRSKVLPYETRFKGCEAFIKLPRLKQQTLLSKIILNPGCFTIDQAKKEVSERLKYTVMSENIDVIAKYTLAWWDREAVESLTGERNRQISKSELLEFISKKNAELYKTPFTNDLEDMELPAVINPDPIHFKQLEIIEATESQKRRSYKTEMKARIQRDIWMNNTISTVRKLDIYDQTLIEEWSYIFDDHCSNSMNLSEEEIKKKGRELLDWSHKEAHLQITPIVNTYTNPDLIRGSYQMLSSVLKIGWHVNYIKLITKIDEDK